MQGQDTAERWQRTGPGTRRAPGGIAVTAISLCGLVLLWILAATLTADPQVLPQPWDLIGPFAQELRSGDLLYHLGRTLGRVAWPSRWR